MKELKNKHWKIIFSSTIIFLMFISIVWASSGGNNDAAPKGWSQIDSSKLLNFAVLIIALICFLRKPFKEFLSSRLSKIKEELKDLEQKKTDAKNKLAEYEEKFKNLEQEAKKIMKDYIAQGKEANKRIVAEAEAQAEKLETKAKLNIEQEILTAKTKLKEDIVQKTLEKAEKLVQESISSNDQKILVNEYLKKVVA